VAQIELLSIIIPCQEDGILLVPTLKSIFLNKFPPKDFEVLLIHSDDVHISESVNKFSIRVYSGTFKGQAQALNWGIKRAFGDVVCTTKPGCVVAPNWLVEIARFLQHNPNVDGVGGPVLPCREYGTRIQKLASQIFHEEQGFPSSVTIAKSGHYHTFLHSTNSAFRKEVLASMKFDETFNYDYDFDLCWRMLQKGRRLVFNPEMKIQYIFPSSLRSLLGRYYVWGKENVILRKKYASQTGLKAHINMPYITVRELLQPSLLGPNKKLLRFIQHVAFNIGCINGYSVH